LKVALKLQEIFGNENVHLAMAERICYSRDMSVHVGIPDAVVFAETAGQVSKLLALANQERIPVVPRGSGTSVTGAVIPTEGGIVLDLSRMDRIEGVDLSNFRAVVQPGVVCGRLNAALKEHGLFFPPDPGSSAIATIGGMIATNASGLRAVKYGTTKDYVTGLDVVLADGSCITTGTAAPKASAGYDLTRLFVCSEGTLGVVVKAALKVIPAPARVAIAVAFFPTLDAAGTAVMDILMQGIPLCAGEIMDAVSISVVREAMKLTMPDVQAMLLLEVDGEKESVKEQIRAIEECCRKRGGIDVRATEDPAERAQFWRGRAGLVSALCRLRPGYRLIPICEDFGVPIPKIADAIRGAQEIAKKNDILIATFGHVGDGNVHTTFVVDTRKKEEWERMRPAADELVDLAMKLGGTVSAEHGIGYAKSPFFEREVGSSLDLMRRIKKAFDPNNILNPGKLALEKKTYDIFDKFAFEPILDGKHEITSLGAEADNETLICVQCGFCRSGCPTFEETRLESLNARGRVILAYNLYAGNIEASPELAAPFYRCTNCRNCTVVCPSQIKTADIVQSCREYFHSRGLAPQGPTAVIGNVKRTGNPFALSREERIASYTPPFRERAAKGTLPARADVLLFAGCVPAYVDMKVVASTIENLEAAGESFTLLGLDEPCCGFPVYLAGAREEFKTIALENRDRILQTGAKILLTPCAGCRKSFSDLYGKYAPLEGITVLHIVEYLAARLREGRLKPGKEYPKRVAYHDPCDLGRHLGIYDEPRALLRAVPGLEILEFKRNRKDARCCGGGGGVSAVDPQLSVRMAARRIQEAVDEGAEIVASACGACKDNLKKGRAKLPKETRKNIQVLDVVEIFSRSL
jgi:glycolate oxidase subunit GlcD